MRESIFLISNLYLRPAHCLSDRLKFANGTANEGLIGSLLAAERGKSTFFVAPLFQGRKEGRKEGRKVARAKEGEGEGEAGRLWATLVPSNNYSPETTKAENTGPWVSPRPQLQWCRANESILPVLHTGLLPLSSSHSSHSLTFADHWRAGENIDALYRNKG